MAELNTLHIQVNESVDSYSYTATLIEMKSAFRVKLINDYSINLAYVKILTILDNNKKLGHENMTKIWFKRESDDLI